MSQKQIYVKGFQKFAETNAANIDKLNEIKATTPVVKEQTATPVAKEQQAQKTCKVTLKVRCRLCDENEYHLEEHIVDVDSGLKDGDAIRVNYELDTVAFTDY